MGIFSGVALASKLLGIKDFLVKNWQFTLLMIALIAGYFYLNGLYSQIEDLEQKNEQIVDRLDQCKENKKTLQEGINKRNAQIAEWQSITKKLQDENDQLEKDVNKIKNETSKSVDEILNSPKINTCEEAIEYLYEEKDEIQW